MSATNNILDNYYLAHKVTSKLPIDDRLLPFGSLRDINNYKPISLFQKNMFNNAREKIFEDGSGENHCPV